MLGHVAVKDTPSIMHDDEKAVQHAEGERRHGKETIAAMTVQIGQWAHRHDSTTDRYFVERQRRTWTTKPRS
jgi:hypothetical protein